MESDFLAVAAGRAASGDTCRENAYLYFLFPKLPYCRPLVCKSCFQAACWVQAEPRSHLPLTGPCSRLAQELLRNCKGRVLMAAQLMASTSLLRSQWPSPKLFPAWEPLSWTGQIELLPPCKAVYSSSFCILSSAGTWIPSLRKVRYCWSFPALSSAMCFLLSSALAPACNSGFWAYMNVATALSSLTQRLNATNWVIRGILLHVK